jgi:hypothetical protein
MNLKNHWLPTVKGQPPGFRALEFTVYDVMRSKLAVPIVGPRQYNIFSS